MEPEDRTTPDDPANVDAVDPTPSNDEVPFEQLPGYWQDQIKSLRDEAANRRIALKKQEEESKKREQKRLADEGRYKDLATQYEAQVGELMPYKEKYEEYDSVIRESNNRRIESVPEDMRDLIPVDYEPLKLQRWLDANMQRLQRPVAPQTNAGAGVGSGGGQAKLTAEDLQYAALAGMTPEEWAASKAKAGK